MIISWVLVLALASASFAPSVRLGGYASARACADAGGDLLRRYLAGGAPLGAIRASCEPSELPVIR